MPTSLRPRLHAIPFSLAVIVLAILGAAYLREHPSPATRGGDGSCCTWIATMVSPRSDWSYLGDMAIVFRDFFIVKRIATHDAPDWGARVTIDHGGLFIAEDSTSPSHDAPPQCIPDFPENQDALLAFSTYSGGAHCCITWHVCVDRPGDKLYSAIDASHFSSGERLETYSAHGKSCLMVRETKFAYYQGLCFACSPSPNRLLVYEPSGWRPDRPGEFPEFHLRELNEALGNHIHLPERYTLPGAPPSRSLEDELLAFLIPYAYHLFMAGQSEEEITASLNAQAHEDHHWGIKMLVDDICGYADAFNPVTNTVIKPTEQTDLFNR